MDGRIKSRYSDGRIKAWASFFVGAVLLGMPVQAKNWSEVGPGIRAKYFPAPDYPLNALASGISGRVLVRAEGNADGTLKNVTIVESSGEQLIDLGVKRWIYGHWSFPKDTEQDLPRVIEIPMNFQATKQAQEEAKVLLEKVRQAWTEKRKKRMPYPENESFPRPMYPYEARKNNWDGTVTLKIKANAEGQPTAVTVSKSSGHAILDQNTVELVLFHWNFKNINLGKPMEVEVPLMYEIKDKSKKWPPNPQ
jgi:TonB family protein